ncbi:hypothetical protein CWI36_0604p0040 [Hamiltosporidium magnivora]|uniref:Uncharacterized protein n=1 Tax=Hamiltosporidium magnivora TaxID=148818 RepID=A0A4Q9LCM2_9MICR|nr:hypothetical protein CWI36_0604p0040 [Hamiltosporidium magnivora]
MLKMLVQEIIDKEYAEIRVDTRTKTDVKIRGNRPDIIILDKRQTKISLIEIRITSQDSLQIVETEKLKKYDLCANEEPKTNTNEEFELEEEQEVVEMVEKKYIKEKKL